MPDPSDDDLIRILSFNLWHGGDAGGQPLRACARVIEDARADIVGLQETHGFPLEGPRPDNSEPLAAMLGWHRTVQRCRTAILGRLPIIQESPDGWGVKSATPSGRQFWLFNVHLAYWPYQPYQLLKIPYEGQPAVRTEAEAVEAARETRGWQIDWLLEDIGAVQSEQVPILITGDFNEPSHQDWTPAAARAGLVPLPVQFPCTRALVEAGFVDAYRSRHPDEVARPGHTWTPLTRPDDPGDHHDRIDFVFVRGSRASVQEVELVGPDPEGSDLVIDPYPSDHRAVVATVGLH